MATRLDRLFVLLESGSSSATRQAAAKQLGEVVRIHPQELPILLTRLLKCIRSASWETRVAAGHAVSAIAKNVPFSPPAPSSPVENGDVKPDEKDLGEYHRLLTMTNFDASSILGNNGLLTASEGLEYNHDSSAVSGDKQQSMIRKKLGLDFAEKIGMDTSDIVSYHDLAANHVVEQESKEIQITVKDEDGKQATIGVILPAIKKRKLNNGEEATMEENEKVNPIHKAPSLPLRLTGTEDASGDVTCDPKQWPFAQFTKILCQSLFSPRWEARHGSATALREVVRMHGQGVQFTSMKKQEWFEDVALRLVCVLMLDRFGDFVSDQVVAPVREAAAQALGWVAKFLDEPRVAALVDIFVNLTSKTEWQVRHGALLGIKYIIAVREDLLPTMVPRLYDHVFRCLGDSVDDVAAAAAAALVPAANTVISVLPERVEQLLSGLWDSLLNLDELTAATSNVMTLLSKLLAQPHSDERKLDANNNLKDLVPRLWHFLGHNSTSVRRSTLEALQMLVENQTIEGKGAEWLHAILPVVLGQIFFRALIETAADLHEKIFQVWESIVLHVDPSVLVAIASPAITGWLALLMSQQHMHLDLSLLGHGCKIVGRESPVCLGGCDGTWTEADKEEQCTKARLIGIKMLGFLSGPMTVTLPNIDYGGSSPVEMFAQLLKNPLEARSAFGRIVVSLVLAEWAERWPETKFPDFLAACISDGLEQVLYYDEIAHAFTRLQQDAKDFMASVHHSFPHVPPFADSTVLTLNQVHELGETWAPQVFLTKKIPLNRTVVLEDQRRAILNSAEKTSRDQKKLTLMCNACMAEALVAIGRLPEKLSPTVRSLMDSIKMQKNELLRGRAAKAIAKLLKLCINRTPQPNPKIVKNLITYATTDPLVTPKASDPCESLLRPATTLKTANGNAVIDDKLMCSKTNGIFGLYKERVLSEDRSFFRRQESQHKSEPGTPVTPTANGPFSSEPDMQREAEVLLRIGGEEALVAIASIIGSNLRKDVPCLWDAAFSIPTKGNSSEDDEAQNLVNCLRTAEIIVPHLSGDLLPTLQDFVRRVLDLLEHNYTAVRHMASRVMAALASACPSTFVGPSLPHFLRLLEKVDVDTARQGGLEAVSCLLDKTGLKIVPYVPIFIVPVLKRMSDTCVPVRLLAAKCFANLVRLMPLASSRNEDLKLEPELEETRREQMNFLTQLLNPTLMGDIPVPEKINAKLRRYQQDGFNWLMFLDRFQLHGILCDDMGLGKTLQTICLMVASYEDLAKKKQAALPSIVICPPTLVGHWFYEVEKFVVDKALNPLQYAGPPGERSRLRLRVPSHNLVIASYDIIRNDIEFFSSIRWNYCILDEGHVIKNGKTKMSKAIKQLTASHRLILSGTPIQNNVLELWSLLDFLMPGFLGSEREFSWRYSRPILQSRDGKATPAEQQSGALALEALHRQMLPFMLRRMKTDVLDDLPPKITQDYYCELSPLQQKLYEDFSKSQTCKELGSTLESDGKEAEQPADDGKKRRPNAIHVFQALQYLRKVCNHPKLVLGEHHPEWASVKEYLQVRNSKLDDISHSAKLPALKQLLNDCGIGISNGGSPEFESVVSQHRVLVFCQLKSMLDIIETDLFKKAMPEVTYLRLDGSVPTSQRHDIVQRFNADVSIDVLLLTTQVGGLGLNLTGADTVIFVEHDWNPMKDVQAMDRAHRIGQKKVVNVYRLITRGTLEEKIMGLQKFKLYTANSVINQENSALSSMSTDQLLEAFTFSESRGGSTFAGKGETGGHQEDGSKPGLKSVLEALPDLWEESQYDEFSLDAFITTLKDGKS